MNQRIYWASLGFVFMVVGCANTEQPPSARLVPIEINERYLTNAEPQANIDSVAVASPSDDGPALLFATAKTTDVLRVFDASNGKTLRDIGSSGAAIGQMQRPNGVATIDDLLLVVERDNHRVQAFSLANLAPVAVFGADLLRKPYGLWLHRLEPDRYRMYVTDNYEMPNETVPPDAQLGERIKTWRLQVLRDGRGAISGIEASFERSFGATSGPGVLRVVESIYGDPANDRLLIAEEDPAGGRVLKVYTLGGEFTGQLIGEGLFATQPEGIALYACPDGSGYWISTDQSLQRNIFYIFERRSLKAVGAFAGRTTRNTDGIWLAQQPLPEFPAGAFFAVDDDRAVAAFDWQQILQSLRLQSCPLSSAAL